MFWTAFVCGMGLAIGITFGSLCSLFGVSLLLVAYLRAFGSKKRRAKTIVPSPEPVIRWPDFTPTEN